MSTDSQPPIQIQPDTPGDQQWSFVNQNFQALANSLNPLIISNGTANSIILGKQTNGTYSLKFLDNSGVGVAEFSGAGLKVAQSGVEVSTATNAQLVFNSNQDVFKIVQSGTATVTPPNSWVGSTSARQVTTTVAHNLGFQPAFLAFAVVPTYGLGFPQEGQLSNCPIFLTSNQALGANIYMSAQARVDTTNIYFDVILGTSNTVTGLTNAWTFKYYILQETAT